LERLKKPGHFFGMDARATVADFDTDRAGLGGICAVLAIGLVGMIAVRTTRRAPV